MRRAHGNRTSARPSWGATRSRCSRWRRKAEHEAGADGRRIGHRRHACATSRATDAAWPCWIAMRRRSWRARRSSGRRATWATPSLAAAVDEAAAALGGLDVVVAAAGIAARGTVADTAPADWDRVLAVNLRGVYLTGRAAIPHRRAAGGGASQHRLAARTRRSCACRRLLRLEGRGHLGTRAMAIDHAPRASASTASARGRQTRCSSRTSPRRQIRRGSARPTRRCSCTGGSSQPKRSPARWPTWPRPASSTTGCSPGR